MNGCKVKGTVVVAFTVDVTIASTVTGTVTISTISSRLDVRVVTVKVGDIFFRAFSIISSSFSTCLHDDLIQHVSKRLNGSNVRRVERHTYFVGKRLLE